MGIHGVVAVAVGGLLALASVEVEGPEPGGCEAHGDFASLLQVTKPDSVSDIAARLRAMPGYLPVTTPEDAERFRQIGVECHLQDGDCPLSGMNKSSIVHVYPGGESACLDPSTPYYFEVKPGDADKLLISFQGGGACWEKLIVDIGLCTTSVTHDNWHGLLNYENMQNPYRSYTMVKILYCSGDMHAGDTEQPWGKSGEMLQLRGYRNAGAAVSWALANFPHLTDLTLIGQSAGSLGVQWWARRMLQSFKDRGARTVVIPDSFAGVLFPPARVEGTETFLFDTWNMCHDDTLTPLEKERCLKGELLLSDMFVETMRRHREARFGMINSKVDHIQRLFEKMIGASGQRNIPGALMTRGQYYKWLNLLLQREILEPNFRVYLVDGKHHVYTSQSTVFQTTPKSCFNCTHGGRPALIDWVDSLSRASCTAKKVVCIGKSQLVVKNKPPPQGARYCDETLVNLA